MDRQELQSLFDQRDVRRVKLAGVDIDGVLRGKFISVPKFWSALEKGFGFCDVIFGWDVGDELYDNATLTGWHSGYPDVLSRIDPTTLRFLPSEPHTAHFLIDFYRDEKHPHPACPRNLLKSVVARLGAAGFRAEVGVELEYWIFRETPASLREKSFQDLSPLSPGMFGYSWVRTGQFSELLADLHEQLTAFDIDVEAFHTETGPGVYETALNHADPLRAADMAALFKSLMKVLCARHGLSVTFMAKWNAKLPGSSGHIHQSLWDSTGSQNLFADPKAPEGLSQLGRHYIGGLCQLSPALTALFAPNVNSYKRYVPGMWAPMTASWGIENRTCSMRAITGQSEKATRLEFRQPAADLNPHIAIAACLAAGLYGVTQAVEPPAPAGGDATQASAAPPLPHTLAQAVAKLTESDLVRQVLPEEFVDHYVRTRQFELRQFEKGVTDWELARYFESI